MRPKPGSADNAAPREPASETSHVLPFRRRGALFTRNAPPPVSDLGEYRRTPEEPDDYRHRMIMNGLAFVATIVLVVVGIWIADVMAHMRKNQDCVLTGRAGCTPVDAPLRQR